jgi:hypothetical protein
MPSPGEISYVFTVIGFTDAVAQHAIATYHDLDALEGLFYRFINNLPGV